MREELREARENRGAAVGVAVWTPKHAPAGIAPFTMVGDDVHVVVDPEAPDTAYLEAAIRLARLLALATLREREVDVDAAAIGRALAGVREQLEVDAGDEDAADLRVDRDARPSRRASTRSGPAS